MAENSSISWTTHTFNPWMGCQKVAAGCTNCYAEAFAKRYNKAAWGPHGTRVKTSEAYWKKPLKWNREAAKRQEAWSEHVAELDMPAPPSGPGRPRVFCASLADIFEDWQGNINSGGLDGGIMAIDDARTRLLTMNDLRRDLFALIDATPHLDWLILSKRPENIRRMIENIGPPSYNPVHEYAQGTRANRLSSSAVRRTGNRQRGSNLEGCEADGRPMARGNANASVPQSEGGESIPGVPSTPRHGERQTLLRDGSSLGVVSPSWIDPDRTDDQPQEWQQARQSTGEPGASDVERESTARPGSSQRGSKQTEGIEAPEDASNRSGRSSDPPASRSRRAGEGNCRIVRNETEGRERNLQSPDLDSHLSPYYRPNVWLLTSIATQEDADRNVPELLKCRDLCPVLGLSCEPLLGPVDLEQWLPPNDGTRTLDGEGDDMPTIDWVIVGGESGAHRREMPLDAAIRIWEQCKAADVPCFVKQDSGPRPGKQGRLPDHIWNTKEFPTTAGAGL